MGTRRRGYHGGYRVALYMSLQDVARAQPVFLTQFRIDLATQQRLNFKNKFYYDRRATAASSSSSIFRRSVLNCSSKSASEGGPYRSASVNAISAQSAGDNVSSIAGVCYQELNGRDADIV